MESRGKRDILDMQWSELESRADFVKNRFSDVFKPDMLWKNLRLEKDDREGGAKFDDFCEVVLHLCCLLVF